MGDGFVEGDDDALRPARRAVRRDGEPPPAPSTKDAPSSSVKASPTSTGTTAPRIGAPGNVVDDGGGDVDGSFQLEAARRCTPSPRTVRPNPAFD